MSSIARRIARCDRVARRIATIPIEPLSADASKVEVTGYAAANRSVGAEDGVPCVACEESCSRCRGRHRGEKVREVSIYAQHPRVSITTRFSKMRLGSRLNGL